MTYNTASFDASDYSDLTQEHPLDEAKLAYYEGAVDPVGLTAAAAKVVGSEKYVSFCNELVDELSENPAAFAETVQSVVEYQSGQQYTLAELMEAAPLSQQRGLQPSTLSKLWADTHTGFGKMPLLLRDPEVIVLPNGKIRLLGGNHRVALIYSMCMTGGMSQDDALGVLVRTQQCSINMGALRDRMTAFDENDEPVLPNDADVIKAAYHISFLLWIASNQSRAMTATEIKDASSYASGVNRNDEGEILESAFGENPIQNPSDACRMLARLHAVRHYAPLTTEDGRPIVDPTIVPVIFEYGALKLNTFESIVASAFAAIMKVSQDVSKPNSKTGEVKLVSHKTWAKDGKEGRGLTRLADLFAANIDTAITEFMSSLPADSPYAGNVARNAAKIGAVLAELVDSGYEPLYPYVAPTAKAKANKAKRSSLTLGL